jgi:hypothetical protein
MAVVSLPLDPGSEARTILHHLLEHGDLGDRDAAGRTLITLAVNDWLLERLLTFDAGPRTSRMAATTSLTITRRRTGRPASGSNLTLDTLFWRRR